MFKTLLTAMVVMMLAAVAWPRSERLIVAGSQIVAQDGRVVELKGINWSEPDLCTSEDMTLVRSWGANVVRVWCDEASIRATYLGSGRGKFDISKVIEWADREGLHLILTIGDLSFAPTNIVKPWEDRRSRFHIEHLADVLAYNVAGKRSVLAIEFQNEPPAGKEEIAAYTAFNKKMAESIRDYAPWTSVIVHGPRSLDDFDEDVIVGLPYVIYSVNFWEPYSFTHTSPAGPWPTSDGKDASWIASRLGKVKALRDDHNVPVMLTEFGAMVHAPGRDEIRWVKDVTRYIDKEDIHGIYWGFRSYRAASFHIFYNSTDKMKPPVYREWTDMRDTLFVWFNGSPFEQL